VDKLDAASIAKYMEKEDKVAVWLGIKVEEVREGKARVSLKVRKDMLNAAGLCQGGVIFSLADFAFAVAANSYGKLALAISASIYFAKSVKEGATLIAEAKEVTRTKRLGVYEVIVKTAEGEKVALFTGEVYVKDVILKEKEGLLKE